MAKSRKSSADNPHSRPPDGTPHHVRRPFSGLADRSTAPTRADVVRHKLIRRAFLNLLLADEQVCRFSEVLSGANGLAETAGEAAAALDELATIFGLNHRSELYNPEVQRILAGAIREFGLTPAEEEQVTALSANAQAKLADVSKKIDCQLVELAFAPLVYHHLHLRWPWVTVELSHAFMLHIEGYVKGHPFRVSFDVAAKDSVTPLVEATFRPDPGESLEVALRRLSETYRHASERLRQIAESTPSGRRPKNDGRHLEDYARWFYQRRVLGQTTRAIAMAEHRQRSHELHIDDCACRKKVEYGIQTAEKLLGLVQHVYPESPLEK